MFAGMRSWVKRAHRPNRLACCRSKPYKTKEPVVLLLDFFGYLTQIISNTYTAKIFGLFAKRRAGNDVKMLALKATILRLELLRNKVSGMCFNWFSTMLNKISLSKVESKPAGRLVNWQADMDTVMTLLRSLKILLGKEAIGLKDNRLQVQK